MENVAPIAIRMLMGSVCQHHGSITNKAEPILYARSMLLISLSAALLMMRPLPQRSRQLSTHPIRWLIPAGRLISRNMLPA